MTTTTETTTEHDHYTISTVGGCKQAIWSTKDECVKCGTGSEHR